MLISENSNIVNEKLLKEEQEKLTIINKNIKLKDMKKRIEYIAQNYNRDRQLYVLAQLTWSLLQQTLNTLFAIAYVFLVKQERDITKKIYRYSKERNENINIKFSEDFVNIEQFVIDNFDCDRSDRVLNLKTIDVLFISRIISTTIANIEMLSYIFKSDYRQYLYEKLISKEGYEKFNSVSVFTSWLLLIWALEIYSYQFKKFGRFMNKVFTILAYSLMELFPFLMAYAFSGMILFMHKNIVNFFRNTTLLKYDIFFCQKHYDFEIYNKEFYYTNTF